MNDWTSGYVADIGYTFGYYTELNPARIKLAFLNAGLAYPEIGTACELGFGQGVSTNFHATASLVKWHGTDFNPSQASFAQELSRVSASSAELYDESFEEFCNRELPEFDFIGLHGIWSWISDKNREVIVDFLRRKLKVGGVLYISYNTLPGWGAFAPMRHLMTQHALIEGADGAGIVSKINDAIDFTEKLLSVNPGYARANPQIKDRVEKLKAHNRQYLAHEYFNADWEPMHFSEMSRWLSRAKLQFACSASLMDSVEAVNLQKEQSEFLNKISDPIFKETTRDFLVNQQFRKDYWVKGRRTISPVNRSIELKKMRMILIKDTMEISFKINTVAGEASLNEDVYRPLIEILKNYKVKSIAEIEEELKDKGIAYQQLIQAIIILASLGHIGIVQDDFVISKKTKAVHILNTHIMELARSSGDIAFLASPVTGGGHAVPRFQQIFLLARQQGHKTPAQWAEFAWMWLKAQGQSLLKDGQPLKTEEENLAELKTQAIDFESKHLPILKALQIA